MGEDRNGLPKVLEEAGRQDDLLSYLGGRVMMGEDKDGSMRFAEASRQDDLLKVPKCEIFYLFDFNDFYGIKSLKVGDLRAEIKN